MKDKKGLKSPLGRAILAVVIIGAIVIGLCVFMGTMNKNALLNNFQDNEIGISAVSSETVSKQLKKRYDDLENVTITTKTAGSFFYGDEDSAAAGFFMQFKSGADEVFDCMKNSLMYCIKKGDCVFVLVGNKVDDKIQKVIDKTPGSYTSNR